jgi:hypothetical protein
MAENICITMSQDTAQNIAVNHTYNNYLNHGCPTFQTSEETRSTLDTYPRMAL